MPTQLWIKSIICELIRLTVFHYDMIMNSICGNHEPVDKMGH